MSSRGNGPEFFLDDPEEDEDEDEGDTIGDDAKSGKSGDQDLDEGDEDEDDYVSDEEFDADVVFDPNDVIIDDDDGEV